MKYHRGVVPHIGEGVVTITGMIFDIKRFSIHDGPGIRSTVFFKGCHLDCWWCHNPESRSPDPQLMLRPQRCIGCGACVAACPDELIRSQNAMITTDLSRCRACGTCVDVCYSGARELVGRRVDVDEVIAVLERDRPFYEESGGGITVSGGEPLQQPDFLFALLGECKSRRLHTALDTCGQASWETLDRMRTHVDLFLYDLKHIDDEVHRTLTSVSNEGILENLERLAQSGCEIIVRTPIIPGFNDDENHVRRLGAYVATLPGVMRVELLPYHAIAREKYRQLDEEYRLPHLHHPSAEHMRSLAHVLEPFPFDVRIRG